MDVDRKLLEIAKTFRLWDMAYTLEAIDHVISLDLADRERVELTKAVLAAHFELRAE
jgi:hypothetical protein